MRKYFKGYMLLFVFILPFQNVVADSDADLRAIKSECFSHYKEDMGYAKALNFCVGKNTAMEIFIHNKHDSGLLLPDFIEGIMLQVTKKVGGEYFGRLVQFYDTGFTGYPTASPKKWQIIRRVNWTYIRNPLLLGRKGFYIIYAVDIENRTVNFSKKITINN